MNNGNGTFGPLSIWPVGTCGNGEVDAFDMDHDNDLDVFLTDYLGCMGGESDFIWISRNRGNGTFDPPYVYVTYVSPEDVEGADVNGDGHQDLLWTETQEVGVALGDGTGNFGPFARFATDWGPKDFTTGDFNGDGAVDVATCNMGGDPQQSMCVLTGRGDGTFFPHVRHVVSYSPDLGGVAGITAGDVDGDQAQDILVANCGSGDFSYFHNLGGGTFEPHIRYGLGFNAAGIAFGDLTGDGIGDVASTVGYPPSNLDRGLVVVRGTGAGSLTSVTVGAGFAPIARLSVAPNPSKAGTRVEYVLPQEGTARLTVHDVTGRLVAVLFDGRRNAGTHAVAWNAHEAHERGAASGIYFVRLETRLGVIAEKLILAR